MFARTAMGALSAGLSWRDLRHMKYTHLVLLLYAYEDNIGAEYDEVSDAKPSDVRMLMSM